MELFHFFFSEFSWNLKLKTCHALICVEVSVSIKCFDWSKMAAEVFPVARIDEYAKPCEPAIHVLRSVVTHTDWISFFLEIKDTVLLNRRRDDITTYIQFGTTWTRTAQNRGRWQLLVSYTNFIALVPHDKQSVGDGETGLSDWMAYIITRHHANLITTVLIGYSRT